MTIQEPQRTRLPDVRPSITHKRTACGVEFYTTVSFYEGDNSVMPAELFVSLGKRGDVVAGLVDGLCITVSLALQYGVPWEKLSKKFIGQRFGADDPEGLHTSILDGIAQSVDHCIQARKDMVGFDEEPPEMPPPTPPEAPAPVPASPAPTPPPLQEAAHAPKEG